MNDANDFDSTWTKYWQLLYADLATGDYYPTAYPLLAHYTTLENIEKILRSQEMWLSNPLLMNDSEEVKFGVLNGLEIIRASGPLRDALGSDQRRKIFFDAIDEEFEAYGSKHVLDLYVICFSKHSCSDDDGQLSMWRGYGNQGKGAALVFDTSKLPVPDSSPLALGPVSYGTQEKRMSKISEKVDEVAKFLSSNTIPDGYVASVATELFERLCVFSVFSKHDGFREENEWRLVYLKKRDQPESKAEKLTYEKYFSYFNGPSGMQPKLKLPIGELLGSIGQVVKFTDLIDRIIIGATAASPWAKLSVERMLISINMGNLIDKIKTSGIPFRG
jgi:hypothetical protein